MPLGTTAGKPFNKPASLVELALRIGEPQWSDVRAMYSVFHAGSVRMIFDEEGWEDARGVFGANREAVEKQSLVFVRSRYLAQEAVLNPLRALRSGAQGGSDAAELIDRELRKKGCRWCERSVWHVSQTGRLTEEFGAVVSRDGRFVAIPNWARLAPVSGMIYGDEHAHNLFRLSAFEFRSLFSVAAEYIERARRHDASNRYFMCFLNGGPRSAGSVAHAHLQVVGRPDRHFGVAEQVAVSCPPDYWRKVSHIHESLGLARRNESAIAWANLCPVKERDTTMISEDLVQGAEAVYQVLRALIGSGTSSFSLAAFLRPRRDKRFSQWPGVVWRLVDRGDALAMHADIGSLELLGATAAVATDPWTVAGWLEADAGGSCGTL
jgi:diadenosine tetraphosphate (Ap4A) HIT family hydrolase